MPQFLWYWPYRVSGPSGVLVLMKVTCRPPLPGFGLLLSPDATIPTLWPISWIMTWLMPDADFGERLHQDRVAMQMMLLAPLLNPPRNLSTT